MILLGRMFLMKKRELILNSPLKQSLFINVSLSENKNRHRYKSMAMLFKSWKRCNTFQ